ncbi:hypothetical protein [Mesorhizobium sp. Root157]|nr:hypothetical protein [Mesorhizobium sp. Root157]
MEEIASAYSFSRRDLMALPLSELAFWWVTARARLKQRQSIVEAALRRS